MIAAEHTLMLDTPEDIFVVRHDAPAFVPVDAINCSLNRARATLLLLADQFDGQHGCRLSDNVISDALWSIEGYMAEVKKLVDHACRSA